VEFSILKLSFFCNPFFSCGRCFDFFFPLCPSPRIPPPPLRTSPSSSFFPFFSYVSVFSAPSLSLSPCLTCTLRHHPRGSGDFFSSPPTERQLLLSVPLPLGMLLSFMTLFPPFTYFLAQRRCIGFQFFALSEVYEPNHQLPVVFLSPP